MRTPKKRRNSDTALIEEQRTAKPFSPPAMTRLRRAEMERAANLYATAHNSDPFSHRRIITHMRRGLELPSDVILEAQTALEIRERAKAE